MFLAELKKGFASVSSQQSPSRYRFAVSPAVLLRSALGAALCFSLCAHAQTCPDLQPYYPTGNATTAQQWAALLPQLENLMPQCLESSEYFALLGAARLNTSQVAGAMESLERALLLNPDNGAAHIDYAEALFLAGLLFPALEMNGRLLQRPDLPANLAPVVQARQQAWQQLTRQHQFLFEATAGYDDNLNGAPSRNNLTLTLDGIPVELTLEPEFQPREGAFTNLRLGGSWQQRNPGSSHDLMMAARARFSTESDTDLAQLDWRYTYSKSHRRQRWDLTGGTSHLMYSGSPLYTVTELRARFSQLKPGCQPTLDSSLQYLIYHGQSVMNGVEGGVAAGLGCLSRDGRQQWRAEAGYLNNQPIKGNRPGGTREGWQAQFSWQWVAGPHQLDAQLRYTALEDSRAYSPLLGEGAVRDADTHYVAIRYKRALKDRIALLVNLTHQDQGSNLQPFNSRGTVAEAGLSLSY